MRHLKKPSCKCAFKCSPCALRPCLLNWESPISSRTGAAKLKISKDGLHRLLRVVAGAGIVRVSGRSDADPDAFELTDVGDVLRSDVPGSMRASLMALAALGHWLVYGKLDEAVVTGQPSTVPAHGKDIWSYYKEHDTEAQIFAKFMSESSSIISSAVLENYPFDGARKIVDVGGSHGSLLIAVLKSVPESHGVLFDTPEIAETAHEVLRLEGLENRIEVVAGDFFTAVPEGDVYLLKHILHDWNDEQCIRILTNVRKALVVGGRVLIIEAILESSVVTNSLTMAAFMDIAMLAMTTGRERTVQDFSSLLAAADLTLRKAVQVSHSYHVLEAVAA